MTTKSLHKKVLSEINMHGFLMVQTVDKIWMVSQELAVPSLLFVGQNKPCVLYVFGFRNFEANNCFQSHSQHKENDAQINT